MPDTPNTDDSVTYVDAEPTPGANYVGRSSYLTGTIMRVDRPPLTGHVHVRGSNRCIHRDAGELCENDLDKLRRVVGTLREMVERRDRRLGDLEALADEWDRDFDPHADTLRSALRAPHV